MNQLPHGNVTLLPGKSIQLRLECIDALETHFTSGSTLYTHQALGPARAARTALLTKLGFEKIEWSPDDKSVVSVKAEDRPGYILTKTFDSYGTRPVAYAFAGDVPADMTDGGEYFLTPDWLGASVNHEMVDDGFAYPMYYEGAFHDLRAKFDAAVAKAQAAGGATNVWTNDVTKAGFAVPPEGNLTETGSLWPKLFRRVSTFFKENPSATLAEFPAWLEANRDDCIDLDSGSWTALHNYVEWDGDVIRLTKDITRLMFKG